MKRPPYIIPLLTIATVILGGFFLPVKADKVSTTRKHLKAASSHNSTTCTPSFTITPPLCDSLVRLCGYDKTANANVETIFISNLSTDTLSSISFTIKYLDNHNREIHRRNVAQQVEVLPSTTHKIDIPTWDRQHTYYYRHSAKPRKPATPYSISTTIDSLTFRAHASN